MTRSKYIIALVVAAILAGVIPNLFPVEQRERIYSITIIIAIGFIMPILGFARLRYMGLSWKEVFFSHLPGFRVFKKD